MNSFLSWLIFYATSGFYTRSSDACPFIKQKLTWLLWLESYTLRDKYSSGAGIIRQDHLLEALLGRYPPVIRLDLTQLPQHGPGAALEALSSSSLALNSFVLKQKPQAQKLKERIVFLRPHTKKATEIPHRNCVVLNCRTGLPNYSKLSSEQHLCQKQNSELV